MTLKETINQNLKDAMKQKDEAALRALRSLKAAILLAETAEGQTGDLTPDQELKLLQKQAKQRKDAIEQYLAGNRQDLADSEQAELTIINKFLPKQISPEELEQIIKTIITEVNAAAPSDLGKVMGAATKQLAGQADGKLISEIAKRLLSK
ncbi:MAG: GatB/YqeY domain-containing protein [Bacteroidia bacterium]|nr:GatB/YqeY domain-containing protein [Bacteroidia bacterium]